MAAPTPLQRHLLRGVQNVALDNRLHRALRGDAAEGVVDEREWIGQRSLAQLEQVALGVGVPKAWVDYARAAGERGERWQPGTTMLGSGHVDRDQLLAGLAHEVRALQDIAGIGAVFLDRGGLDEDADSRFRRVAGMTWQRVGAISHALRLSTEERHQAWRRGQQHWATAVATRLSSAEPKELAQQWNRIVAADFSALAIPVMVLQGAGITAEDTTAAMPTTADDMSAQVAEALTGLDQAGGPARAGTVAAIENAVRAAGPATDAGLDAHAAGTDPPPPAPHSPEPSSGVDP
ncbi:hypothetical protein [Nocardia takedensis]|uniref:hypothetical protein n=1 Tax=Nocardia takedensis TaxID=259390 RepID=UPI0002FC988D|nr:hypothetical protein [Nocardia takedensis]